MTKQEWADDARDLNAAPEIEYVTLTKSWFEGNEQRIAELEAENAALKADLENERIEYEKIERQLREKEAKLDRIGKREVGA